MFTRLLSYAVLAGIPCVPCFAGAQATPIDVPGCDLAKNPKAFVGKLVRVRGTLSVHFEDFSLNIPHCDTSQGIWLAFGGDVPGLVPSTFNDMVRRPGSDLRVDGVPYGIKKDANFWRLYALIAARHGDKPDYTVTATLTGMFFGTEVRDSNGKVLYFGGLGHMICCALLVITEVSDVESVPSANLDVHGVVIGIDGQPVEGFTVIDDVLGGSPPCSRTTVTDKQGRFAFSNSGQQLRVESPDYRPLALTVETGGPEIRVRLEPAKQSDWIIRTCKKVDSSKRVGFSVRFALPEDMESQRLQFDDRQSIFAYHRGGSAPEADLIISRILDGTTEVVSSLDSEWFEERWVKNETGKVLGIDARGRRMDGGYWRTAVFRARDIASYWLEPSKPSRALDEIVNSACLARDTAH
jgi:hypothetical protein